MSGPGGRPWYERYFTADYWVYAAAEYTEARTAAEVDYLAAVVDSEAPGRRVLDVGCGTGRHAVALARRGFDVTGVDVSAWALERAAEAAREAGARVGLHRLDALTASLADWPVSPVDAVLCVQAFGWGTDAQQLRMLRMLRGLLVPGGVLVLDHSNVSAILRMYAARSAASVDGHTFEFLRSYDPLTGRSGGLLRVCRPDGGTVELPDDVRLYQPPEVAALLARAGFEVLGADADFQRGAHVGIDTRYVQFMARAPGWPASALAGHRAPVGDAELDLRWAPDEADHVDEALTVAWRLVAGVADAAPGVADARAGATTDATAEATTGETGETLALDRRARRYDLGDPYGAQRCHGVLSDHFGVRLEPSQVTAGAGATGLLRALAGLAVGDTVLVEPAGHPELAIAAGELGVAVRVVDAPRPDRSERPDRDAPAVPGRQPAVTVLDRPGVIGRVWPLGDVLALADAVAQGGGVLVVDETCASYLPPAESAVTLFARPTRGLVVVRSMSKGYCCGGLRVGFAVCSPELSERVRAVCPPLATGALAMDVALALLRQGDALARLRARIMDVKPRFVELLAAAGLDVNAGDPRLPWVTVSTAGTGAGPESHGRQDAGARLAAFGIAAKAVPVAPVAAGAAGGAGLVRVSVPLSETRWQAARARLGGQR